jgi:transposase InsO family protein
MARAAAWLTAEQIAQRAGVSTRTVTRIAGSGRVICREREATARNGRKVRELLVESLPEELRMKLLQAPPTQHLISAPATPPQAELLPLFEAAQPQENPGRILKLSPEQEKLACERYEAIRPLVEFSQAENRAKFLALRLKNGRSVKRADDLAIYISETIKVQGKSPSPRTLWRWLAQHRTDGLNGLGRKTREDQGTRSFFAQHPAAAVLVAAEYHKSNASVARAYHALDRNRELLQISAEELPSYSTVRNYLDSLPEAMKILAREGKDAYATRCAPHLNRAYTDIPANGIWVLDHQTHDVEVRNDCFSAAPMDAPLRLSLTAFMDMRSRKLIGYCWCVNGSSRSIATALRRGVERYGPPLQIYTDNGKDMNKAAKGAKRTRRHEEVEQAFDLMVRSGCIAQLGITVQQAIAYGHQAKGMIERGFGTVHSGLDAIMPHYTTGNAYTRPDQTVIAGAEHRKLMKRGLGSVSSLMPASQFIKLAETWIEQDYNAQHSHRGRGMCGHTPNEVFDAGYPPDQRRTADPDVLALLLHERRTVYVRRTGVTLDNRRYIPLQSSTESWVAIHSANESNITVAYDPLDPDHIIALDARGRRMAELVIERLAEHPIAALGDGADSHAENDAQIRDMMRTRARLESATAGTIKAVHRAVALAGFKSDLEHLQDRAGLSVPVEDLITQKAIRAATRPSNTATAPASSFDIAKDILGDLLA